METIKKYNLCSLYVCVNIFDTDDQTIFINVYTSSYDALLNASQQNSLHADEFTQYEVLPLDYYIAVIKGTYVDVLEAYNYYHKD